MIRGQVISYQRYFRYVNYFLTKLIINFINNWTTIERHRSDDVGLSEFNGARNTPRIFAFTQRIEEDNNQCGAHK